MTKEEFIQKTISNFKEVSKEELLPLSGEELEFVRDFHPESFYLPPNLEQINDRIKNTVLVKDYEYLKNHIGWNDYHYQLEADNGSEGVYAPSLTNNQVKRIAILGGLGSGKTLYCKYLAYSALCGKCDWITGQDVVVSSRNNIIPFVFSCTDMIELGDGGETVSAEEYLYRGICGAYDGLSYEDFSLICENVEDENKLFIFDDWDKIHKDWERVDGDSYQPKCPDRIFLFLNRHPNISVIITSQAIGVDEAKAFYPLQIYNIKALSDQRIEEYCYKVSEYSTDFEWEKVAAEITSHRDLLLGDQNVSSLKKMVRCCNSGRLPRSKREIIAESLEVQIAHAIRGYTQYLNKLGLKICLIYISLPSLMPGLRSGYGSFTRPKLFRIDDIKFSIRQAINENYDRVEPWEWPYVELMENENAFPMNELVELIWKCIKSAGFLSLSTKDAVEYEWADGEIFDYLAAKSLMDIYRPSSLKTLDICELVEKEYQSAYMMRRGYNRDNCLPWNRVFADYLSMGDGDYQKEIVDILVKKKDAESAKILFQAINESDALSSYEEIIFDTFFSIDFCSKKVEDILRNLLVRNRLIDELLYYIPYKRENNRMYETEKCIGDGSELSLEISLAYFFYVAGDYRSFRKLVDIILQQDYTQFKNSSVYLRLANACQEISDYENAIAFYKPFLSLYKDEDFDRKRLIDGIFRLSLAYMSVGKNDTAQIIMQKILQQLQTSDIAIDARFRQKIIDKIEDVFRRKQNEVGILNIYAYELERYIKKDAVFILIDDLIYRITSLINNSKVDWRQTDLKRVYESIRAEILLIDMDELKPSIKQYWWSLKGLCNVLEDYETVLKIDLLLVNKPEIDKHTALLTHLELAKTYAHLSDDKNAQVELARVDELLNETEMNEFERGDCLYEIASVYIAIEKYFKAYGILYKIMLEKTFGHQADEEVVNSTLANVLVHLKKFDEATNCLWKNYFSCKDILGAYHPTMINTIDNIVDVFIQGNYNLEIAREYELIVYECRRRELGEEHPLTLAALEKINVLAQLEERTKTV